MSSSLSTPRPKSGVETQISVTPPRHMPALDGLRGAAIVLVVACHAALMSRSDVHSRLGHLIDLIMGAGWIGVDLFFVLSGFLITGILLATKESPAYYKSFFARRLLRIFPLYYLFIAFTVWRNHALYTRADVASLMFFYYNWRAVWLGHALPNVNSLWSLAVEEQFYLVWPTIILFVNRKAVIRISLIGILIALLLRLWILPQATTFQSAYYMTPARMDALLVGALLAIWHSNPREWKQVQRLATRAAVFSGALILAIAVWARHFYDFVITPNGLSHSSFIVLGPGCSLLAIFFGALIVKCTGQGRLFRTFNWWPFRRIGKFSYGMYMVHWPLLMIIQKRVMAKLGPLPNDGAAILCFFLLLGSSFAAAWLSFHLFEKHFLRLKRRFPAVNT
jgi:peptidoglycan/LPS O-acetylase OafA/YrhL